METLFINILNMSLTAGWLVLAVVLIRGVFKRLPKVFRCVLWAFVGIRLICPWFIESDASFIPSARVVPTDIVQAENPNIITGVEFLNTTINLIIDEQFGHNEIVSSAYKEEALDSDMSLEQIINVLTKIWLAGVGVMLLYYIVSYVVIKRKVRVSVRYKDNVYICDNISSAFILGIIRPKIYVPSDLLDEDLECIIAHEKAHLTRHDNLWKPLGFLLLTVYWFNPLIWLAYVLFCRDIELACDERVIRNMDISEVKQYSSTLLSCSVSRKMIVATPLAFGEVAVRSRIKSILYYRKPAFWIIVLALITSIIVMIGFMTNPVTYDKTINEELDVLVSEKILEHYVTEYTGNNFSCENHKIIGVENKDDTAIIYMWVLYREYKRENEAVEKVTSSHVPTVMTVSKNAEGNYSLEEYWEPRDGSYYAVDICERFPDSLESEALDPMLYRNEQSEACELLAREHFGIDKINESNSENDEGDSIIRYCSLDNMYWIDLNEEDETCYVCIPWASVLGHTGIYALSDRKLVLIFQYPELGGEITRVFRRDGDRLIYDRDASKNPDVVNMAFEDGMIFELADKEVIDVEVDEFIGDGVMGLKEHTLCFASEKELSENESTYYTDKMIKLNQVDKTFTYSPSMLSSFLMPGTYEYTGDRLILYADGSVGGEIYVFRVSGDKLIYAIEESTLQVGDIYSSYTISPFIIGQVFILHEAY